MTKPTPTRPRLRSRRNALEVAVYAAATLVEDVEEQHKLLLKRANDLLSALQTARREENEQPAQ